MLWQILFGVRLDFINNNVNCLRHVAYAPLFFRILNGRHFETASRQFCPLTMYSNSIEIFSLKQVVKFWLIQAFGRDHSHTHTPKQIFKRITLRSIIQLSHIRCSRCRPLSCRLRILTWWVLNINLKCKPSNEYVSRNIISMEKMNNPCWKEVWDLFLVWTSDNITSRSSEN